MKKALIATYYSSDNYGSFLQANCMRRVLENYGYKVYFWGSKEFEEKDKARKSYGIKVHEVLDKERKVFRIDYELKEIYDLIIVGSDVVWASTKNEAFWGHGLKGKHFISYAASMWGMCSNQRYPQFVNNLIEMIRLLGEKQALSRFDAISVRDQRTKKSIQKIVKKEVVKVVDPTFLIPLTDQYHHFYADKYILVYSYSLNDDDIGPIKDYASRHQLKICVIGCTASWADYNPVVTSEELLSIFKYADAVVSSTFHGTALSIIHHCRFVVYESRKGQQMLEEFGLEDRMVTPATLIETMEKPINYLITDQLIEKKRQDSIVYLEQNIRMEER